MNKVQVWEEKVIIPTYEAGKPDKNPMFLEKRVYQGSSGRIYPHTVIEKISDEKVDKEYTALFLENDYLKVMMLPELGGGSRELMTRQMATILYITIMSSNRR